MSKRLTLLASFLGIGLVAVVTLGLAGCGDTSAPAGSKGGATGTKGSHELTVGFIYVGPKDDYGYNQAHAQGAAAVEKMAGVKVVEEEKVPETADVQKTMASMI